MKELKITSQFKKDLKRYQTYSTTAHLYVKTAVRRNGSNDAQLLRFPGRNVLNDRAVRDLWLVFRMIMVNISYICMMWDILTSLDMTR